MCRLVLTLGLLLIPLSVRAAESSPERASGDLAIQVRAIFQKYCTECHTGSADPGKSTLEILNHGNVIAKDWRIPLVTPGGGKSQLLELVEDGSMPPANRPGPTPAEVITLGKWVKAGAPAYPIAFDERYTLNEIANDLDRENGKVRDRNAAEDLRYASFAHLVRDNQSAPDLVAEEQKLFAALSLATGGAPVKLTPVDPAGTLYRIELAQFGWWKRDLFEKRMGQVSAGPSSLRPFDLLLLEYPFAESRPADDVTRRLEKFLKVENQVRPVPYVRGDWLAGVLASGEKRTPLAEDLLSLAALDQAFSRKMMAFEAPPGPAGPRVLATAQPLRLPKLTDGRVAIPPISGWYAGDVTPDPAPFALTADLVVAGKRVESVKSRERFKLRVTSDRRVFVSIVFVQADGTVIVKAPLPGSVLQPNTAPELSFSDDGFVVSSLLFGGDSATEYLVLFASEVELPPPTVVRSLHADRGVWRFLLEPTMKDGFEPHRVVRRVIPIPVTKK